MSFVVIQDGTWVANLGGSAASRLAIASGRNSRTSGIVVAKLKYTNLVYAPVLVDNARDSPTGTAFDTEHSEPSAYARR